MKKYNLFKILGIFFLGIVLLSWLVPTSTYSAGTLTKGVLDPIGLFDLLKLPVSAFGSYYGYGLFLLVLGGFYAILNATGAYGELVDLTVDFAKKNKVAFLVATIVGFALLMALSGVNYVLFILVPFFFTVLVLVGYNKLSAFAATVGSILVGSFASVYGFYINGYINYFFETNINSLLWAKVLLFALSVAALVYFIMITDKISELKARVATKGKKVAKPKKEELELSLYKKVKSNGSGLTPLLIVLSVLMAFLFIATYNWRYGLNTLMFEQLYQSFVEFKVWGFAIFDALLGSVYPLGYWGIQEVTVVLLLATALISWIYSIKLDEVIETFLEGVKEMLVPALYIVLANVVLTFISGLSGSDLFNTVEHFLLTLTNDFNVFTTAIMTVIGSLLYNDFAYFTSVVAPNMTALYTDAAVSPLMGLVLQTFHGLMMFILPTSLFLIAGLAMFKVSFVDWIKYIWQFLLQLFAIAAFVIILVVLF
jgi:uncharacterized ion transporter superfamily protein YfcC